MHAAALQMKSVYVPSPRVAKAGPSARRHPVPRGDAGTPAEAYFRAVSWDGVQQAAPPTVRTRRHRLGTMQPTFSTRRAFGAVRWTGEKEEPMTNVQVNDTVRAVLDAFGWE
jgi:hypothetical protein